MAARYRTLIEGEMVRDKDQGTRYRVGRVSTCAARLYPAFTEPEIVTIRAHWDPKKGVHVPERTFKSWGSDEVLLVSPNADMFHEEER